MIGVGIADFASLDPELVVEVDDPSRDHRDEGDERAPPFRSFAGLGVPRGEMGGSAAAKMA